MAGTELVKKMLRAVLQSKKEGVLLSHLQGEYHSLTGEFIEFKQLGFKTLEAFLNSIPSVVRMERRRMGEVMCFAAVCKETVHIAQLVARQRSSKKTGSSHMVNCQMRIKPTIPFLLNVKPRTSLRQPDRNSRTFHRMTQLPHGRRPVVHDFKKWQLNKHPQRQRSPVQSPRPEKRVELPSWFQKEVCLNRSPPQTPVISTARETVVQNKCRPSQPVGYNPQVVQEHLKEILIKKSSGIWLSKLPQLYRDLCKEELPNCALKDLVHWSHICMVEKLGSSSSSELLLYPSKELSQSKTTKPPTPLSTEVKQKVAELISKYSSGLWAHALPKLFQEAYKQQIPEHVMADLSKLADVCIVEYPMPDMPKAILYAREPEEKVQMPMEQGGHHHGNPVPPLRIPQEQYPSVLVMEATNTNAIILRYIGEKYSQAQEVLEDKMREYYSQDLACKPFISPLPGQLAAVKVEVEDAVLRVQVCEVSASKVKVYYVDHGFSEIINRSKLLELHENFFQLPFQAAKCRLAGLEHFSQEADVLKKLELEACGKILLAEILERTEMPLVVLYNTSHDDDVNINSLCLKVLNDKSIEKSLQVDGAHVNVLVTNVCNNGAFYCQMLCPLKDATKLKEILEKIEPYFHSQITSEFLVSTPFTGKRCLARYKGKWARVEITSLHSSRVLDVLFIDIGVFASLEVTDLREIPAPFVHDLISISSQAIYCCLADMPVQEGSWSPDAVMWLRNAVLGPIDCRIKVVKLDKEKELVHVYLFTNNQHNMENSLNHQLSSSDVWSKQNVALLPIPVGEGNVPPLPMLLELPKPGHNMDVFVSVACHPGHFVLQLWQDLYKLVVLMGEMILYYNKLEEKPLLLEKNQICAAKVDNNWHRVLVKNVLSNGLVSVYELDYGKHELVSSNHLQPLIEEFCQLPFQAITAELAGVKPKQWSEEASIVFRNHVENKPLVAQVEEVLQAEQPWDRKLVVYLVDTTHEEDIWVHDFMCEFTGELTMAG